VRLAGIVQAFAVSMRPPGRRTGRFSYVTE
jgi:hypothetical protein